MKHLFLLIVGLSLFTLSCTTQTSKEEKSKAVIEEIMPKKHEPPKVKKIDLEPIIEKIREQYGIRRGQIKHEFSSTKIEYYCPDYPEEGHAVYFLDYENKLAHIEHFSTDGSHEATTTEYYFWNEKLFFAFESSEHWEPKSEQLPNGCHVFHENRFYLNEGKIIRHLTKDFKVEDEYEKYKAQENTSNQEQELQTEYPWIDKLETLKGLNGKNIPKDACLWEPIHQSSDTLLTGLSNQIDHFICYNGDTNKENRIWIGFDANSNALLVKKSNEETSRTLSFLEKEMNTESMIPRTSQAYSLDSTSFYYLTHAGNWDYALYTNGKDSINYTIDHEANPYGKEPCF